ncbi:FliA/WhiG family RNA polymerase sigma factor [Geomicrobium sp. JCM 19039]|uniref:FliA/WhiG family RNA polymerase sigma factor n=1 Tax=Geomicrobium sp. JCM 19039 TaxID=1460636 RepID=UPI00045F4A6A|nr:FliA/WhiG family RNA polymerase sigma factor [Geomicrobium sp. JCM 19039]GAK10944.1 RNA polymerase sigma factor [Geomicrobium sp. JCM 19039]
MNRIGASLPRNMEREELRSQGLIGLYDALNKFDIHRDLKFDTYASFRVRGAIIDSLRKQDWLPRSAREKMKRIDECTEQLEQKYARHVTEHDVAKALNMSVDDVLKTTADSYFANWLSIDQETKADGDKEEAYQSMIADQQQDIPHERFERQLVYREIEESIGMLGEKEKLVVSLFYFEELTLTEIGQTLRLSTSRISQIHSKALFKLRKALRKEIAVR